VPCGGAVVGVCCRHISLDLLVVLLPLPMLLLLLLLLLLVLLRCVFR
jgi:hypothetical protein